MSKQSITIQDFSILLSERKFGLEKGVRMEMGTQNESKRDFGIIGYTVHFSILIIFFKRTFSVS